VKRACSRKQEGGTLNTFKPDPNAELKLADTVVGEVGDRISGVYTAAIFTPDSIVG